MTLRPWISIKTSIFCIICSLFHGGSSITIRGTTNGSVTLQPQVTGRIDEVLWKHKGNKMVEWDRVAADPIEYLRFIGRTKLNKETGDVTIAKLTKDDSGEYEAEVVLGAVLKSVKHIVEVIDPVTKVTVSCNSSASVAKLYCEAEGDFLSYSWSGPGLRTEMRGQTGPPITKEKDQDSVYTCVVKNIISNISVAYNSSNCFAAVNAENSHIIRNVLCGIAGVGVAVAVGVICYYKRHSYNCSAGQKTIQETDSGSDSEEEVPLVNAKPEQTSIKDSEPLKETSDTPKDDSKLIYEGQGGINGSEGSRKDQIPPDAEATLSSPEKHSSETQTCTDGEPASATNEQEDAESLKDTEDTLNVSGVISNDDSSGDNISPDAKTTLSSPEKDTDFEESTSSEVGNDSEDPSCIDKTDQHRSSDQTDKVDVKTPDVPTEGPDYSSIDLKGVKDKWAKHDAPVQNEHAPLKNQTSTPKMSFVPIDGPDYRPIDLGDVRNTWVNREAQNKGNVQNAESNFIGPKTGDGLNCKESTLALNPAISEEEKINAKEEKDPGSSGTNETEERRESDYADNADMKTAMESDVPAEGTIHLGSECNDEHKQSQEEVPLVDDESKQTSIKDLKPLRETDDAPKNGSQISPDAEATLSTLALNPVDKSDEEKMNAKEEEDLGHSCTNETEKHRESDDADNADVKTAMESDPTEGTPEAPYTAETQQPKKSSSELPKQPEHAEEASRDDSKTL